jgi:hypothetical protein
MKSNVKAGGILGLVQRICRNHRRKGDTTPQTDFWEILEDILLIW